ncbi:MAG: sigma-54-dependent Fis family transcriptional regulator [Bacteroidales bacterium]|nr:sigma-54-dependent Fis family transcriptional regulator [Bacteroidales bacterium]
MQIIPPPEPQEVQQAKMRFGIVGNAPALIAAIQRAILVAPINISVLVTGESGSGKEFFPKIVHQFSPRKHNKYFAVNCGAIPEGTIDSELFGHEKGAFTSAVSARKGYFEEADGGTIFLDEVAELPLPTQARLLRVLETGEFMKVGSSTIQRTDIRVVAATNVDLQKAIREGRFREDLYYRLSGVQIPVPPLRERGNDILLLARKFATDFAERYTLPPITFSDSARHMMLTYRWPGNIRQLKNIVEQIAIFDAGNEVDRENLLTYIPENETVYTPALCNDHTSSDHSYAKERELLFNMIFRMQREIDRLRTIVDEKESGAHPADTLPVAAEELSVHHNPHAIIPYSPVEDITEQDSAPISADDEKEMIRRALERNDGRRKATAKELNISERTLYRKIKEYDLE